MIINKIGGWKKDEDVKIEKRIKKNKDVIEEGVIEKKENVIDILN
jgi:hypothetical protein